MNLKHIVPKISKCRKMRTCPKDTEAIFKEISLTKSGKILPSKFALVFSSRNSGNTFTWCLPILRLENGFDEEQALAIILQYHPTK